VVARHDDRECRGRPGAHAASDNWGLTNPGLPPVGPGFWIDSRPVARGGFGARPFFLSSGSEFRAPPPPAFGSPAFVAALAEVKQISVTRTPEQIAIAQFWHLFQSPTNASVLNNLAVELLRTHRRHELESARLLFLINGSAYDAAIGCFDSKFAYWYIRPPQADPSISGVAGVVLPPHPSYPSAHSCISGALTESMALAFPDERRRVEEIATEASLSRLYAGIHYRFDMDAGLALGRAIARKAADASLSTIAVR
jgi:membrane-associated phospholipid phosphatase